MKRLGVTLLAAGLSLGGVRLREAEAQFPIPPPSMLAPFMEPRPPGPLSSRRVDLPGEQVELPAREELPQALLSFEGAVEPPRFEDEGPPGGLTLEQAVHVLLQANRALQAEFQEVSKAEADVLTAGLRGNPLVFGYAGQVPYGSYSEQRPGSIGYDITLIQPFDVSGKRLARISVAEWGREAVLAQYSDAVRLQIERLAMAYVDALAAREMIRSAENGLNRLDALRTEVADPIQEDLAADRLSILWDRTHLDLERAGTAYLRARQQLAELLAIPAEQAPRIELSGTLHDRAPLPPPVEALVQIALACRPDLDAERLRHQRAIAVVDQARAERFPDVFGFYTPWDYRDNSPRNRQDAVAWGVGGLVSIPLFDRNQGNIRHASHEVLKTRIALEARVAQVSAEVQRALAEYGTTRAAVQRIEHSLLPRTSRMRAAQRRLFEQGEASASEILKAEQDAHEITRLYLESLVDHRRSMLRLNTVVGHRILP